MGVEMSHKLNEGSRMMEGLEYPRRNGRISIEVVMLEGMVAPSGVCGFGLWVLNIRERKRVEVFDRKCLRRALP